MKKKSVNLFTAVGVLVVLSGAYAGVKAYVAKQEEKEQESEETELEKIVSIEPDDIKSLKFVIDKKEVTFERDNDDWVKSDETEFPVNQDKMTEAAGALNSLEAERVLTDIENLSEYGLDEPSNTITVTISDGSDTILRVGMKNDSTNQYYLEKDDDQSTVYVVDSSAVTPFMKSLYDYAQEDLFPTVDSSTISRIDVESENNSYELEKNPDSGLWNVKSGDETDSTDSAKVSSLTSSISSIAYASFENYNCDNLAEYGLDKPYAEITIDYQEEKKTDKSDSDEDTDTDEDSESNTVMIDAQLVIQIGDESDNDGRYVRLNDSNEIYTISNDTLNSFIGKTNSDFWNMTVSYLSSNNLDRLDVMYGKEIHYIDVSRETSENVEEEDDDSEDAVTVSYRLDGKKLEENKFTTFYNKLINMAGQKRLTEKFDTDSSPEMTVTLTDIDGGIMEVDYYPYDTNYYAADNDGKVYLVNKMTVKEMFKSFENLLEKNDTEEKELSADVTDFTDIDTEE